MRAGKFALITPVITSTEGLWVATIRWIPTARANWDNLAISSCPPQHAVTSLNLPAHQLCKRYKEVCVILFIGVLLL
jgi:hypothetical protein